MDRKSAKSKGKSSRALRPPGPAPGRDVPTPRAPGFAPTWLRWAAPLLVAILTLLVFSNAAPDAIVHDDKFFVPSRFRLDADSVVRVFHQHTWTSAGSSEGVYRPLLLLSIAADGAHHGNSPRGYHTTNILLNAAAALLLYMFLLGLLRRIASAWDEPAPSVLHVAAAAAAAANFGIHPIHTEAVNSVFNRSEMLVTIGILSALLVIQRWEAKRPVLAWSLAAVMYFSALLCRESAVLLPLLAVGMLYLLHPAENWRRMASRFLPLASLSVPLLIYLVLRQRALSGGVPGNPSLAVNLEHGAGLGYQLALAVETLEAVS